MPPARACLIVLVFIALAAPACGGVPASAALASPPPAPTSSAPADDGPSAQELNAARAKVILAAASAWRRNNPTCPTPRDLSARYEFAPDTDLDAAGQPLVVECDEAETRVTHKKPDGDGKEVLLSKPFSPEH
jgi:hypothetical protein